MATEEKEARNTDDIEASIVEYFYERQVSGHRCGYCKSADGFVTNGMWGHRLAGQDYQDLIERGWRRSGKYIYKPIMSRTCCPPYVIRCEALRFKPTRSQRKVARRMRAFLVEGKEPQRASRAKLREAEEKEEEKDSPTMKDEEKANGAGGEKEKDSPTMKEEEKANGAGGEEAPTMKEEEKANGVDGEKEEDSPSMKEEENANGADGEEAPTMEEERKTNRAGGGDKEETEGTKGDEKNVKDSTDDPQTVMDTVKDEQKDESEVETRKKEKKVPRPGVGADPNKPRCRKAKELRLERRNKKLAAREPDPGVNTGDSISEQRASIGEDSEAMDTGDKDGDTDDTDAAAKEVVEEKNGEAKEDKEEDGEPVDTQSEQPAPIEEPKPKIEDEPSQPHITVEELLQLPSDQKLAHQLELKVVDCYPLTQDLMSSFIESFLLYKKYQMAVHGDKEEEISERSFRRFLCDTPLISLEGPIGWDSKYGSFHYQYYLDGKLIMVAVVDILPTYLSSVYVYYDPDYSWLDLGVYSALREIELVRRLNRTKPEFQNYCMGYYIHNNAKMNYKGKYSPSYLLCPDTYRFTPIETARQRLDESKYSRLNDDQYNTERVLSFLGGVLILFEKQVIPYMLFRSYYGHIKDRIVVEYASLVGKALTQRIFLYMLLDGSQQDEDSDD